MSAGMTYDDGRGAYVLEGAVNDDRYRLLVPRDLLDDELGKDAGEDAQRAWIADNLPHIISAYTARTTGGWAKAPWNRILVEEVS